MSPVRRAFSVAFASNWSRMDEGERDEVERKGIAFLHLCCEIALHQISLGRDFMLEHPQPASSWDLESVRIVASSPGVVSTVLDQCQYGLSVSPGTLSKKPTRLLASRE
eukprot:1068632-Pyramimonas_sp.AAC.1